MGLRNKKVFQEGNFNILIISDACKEITKLRNYRVQQESIKKLTNEMLKEMMDILRLSVMK